MLCCLSDLRKKSNLFSSMELSPPDEKSKPRAFSIRWDVHTNKHFCLENLYDNNTRFGHYNHNLLTNLRKVFITSVTSISLKSFSSSLLLHLKHGYTAVIYITCLVIIFCFQFISYFTFSYRHL